MNGQRRLRIGNPHNDNCFHARLFLHSNASLQTLTTETKTLDDGKIGVGYAVEITANFTYVGTWDDPVEDKNPFWAIENVVRRTNFFY